METLLLEILTELRETDFLDEKSLNRIIHKHNKQLGKDERPYAKKRLLPYYLRIKDINPEQWSRWTVDEQLEKRLFKTLQMKPRRTASGVATITVITKPWKCLSDCLYCPNDLRMPKSYLSDEPACQRAERNYFDPYLQVASRLRALTHMGHVTDKIELIILGGTWSDYSQEYQMWYVKELFRALNDGAEAEAQTKIRRKLYRDAGLSNEIDDLEKFVSEKQDLVNTGKLTYNKAVQELYENSAAWQDVSDKQLASFEELKDAQKRNESAHHRVVGLVVETRPDAVNIESLTLMRQLGCTKVQMGIQSLDPDVLKDNNRSITIAKIQKAFELLRIFGFKIHAHFMVNLYGSTPEQDKQDYRKFITDKHYIPDEVKLYPCALIKGTRLCSYHDKGDWQPYSEETLLDILVSDMLTTPPYIRISRVIRDFSAHDIVAGNKKANLRQLIENDITAKGQEVSEIRYREISTDEVSEKGLRLDILQYETTATQEYFLQWVTTENRIAGFLRLSLPVPTAIESYSDLLPIKPFEAMIREVHVYGKVAKLQSTGEGAQHLGLGRELIEKACAIAREQGYQQINVISSIGTRQYYRKLDFTDKGLYQQRSLT